MYLDFRLHHHACVYIYICIICMHVCMHACMDGWMYDHFLAFFMALNEKDAISEKTQILGCVLAIKFGLIPLLIGYRSPTEAIQCKTGV